MKALLLRNTRMHGASEINAFLIDDAIFLLGNLAEEDTSPSEWPLYSKTRAWVRIETGTEMHQLHLFNKLPSNVPAAINAQPVSTLSSWLR